MALSKITAAQRYKFTRLTPPDSLPVLAIDFNPVVDIVNDLNDGSISTTTLTLAGVASGTDALTLTAGDVTLTSGDATLTAGDLVLTLGNATLTSGDIIISDGGLSVAAQQLTPAADNGAGSTIEANVVSVSVVAVTNDANDWITLPTLANVPDGHRITITCASALASNFELRTPTTSNEEINSEDCDGTKEYLCTDAEVVTVVKVNNTIGWMAYAHTEIGAAVAAVVPD